MDEYRFSIILTLYNKAPYIERALHSILTQSKEIYELVIVDDKSTDDSLKVARTYLNSTSTDLSNVQIKIIEHEKNGGPAIARNTALRHVTGDYIFLLDADDEYQAGFLERADYVFRTYNASLLFYQFERDPGGRVLPVLEGLTSVTSALENDMFDIPNAVAAFAHDSFGMNGSSVACKRTALEDLYYQENLNCFEGLDYWYRVARNLERQRGRVCLLAGIQVTIHLTPDSISRQSVKDGGEIYIPCQFDQFRNSQNRDDQNLRRRIYTIWMRNAFLKLPCLIRKLSFIWRFRRVISENMILNLRYR